MTTSLATPRTAPSRARRGHRKINIGRIVAWAYIIVFLFVTIFPFYWIMRTAFSNNYGLIQDPGSFLPVDFTWGPFKRVLGISTQEEALAEGGSGAMMNILLYLKNSLIFATLATTLQVTCATMAAYAFSRLHWRGRNVIFSVMLTALMVPGILTLLPNFVLIKELGLTNTYLGLVAPAALFSAFNIFFLRQFMIGLPAEIEEAALIDGAGRLRVFLRIVIPMSSGPIITLSILTFISTWNDYFWPMLITTKPDVQPLTVALAVFKQSSPQAMPDWAGLMAATLLAAAPMLLLFMIFGKRIVNSIGFTGIK